MILGIDEVGRGSLAGPVTLGGIVLNSQFPKYCYSFNTSLWHNDDFEDLKFVSDSKILSKKKREETEKIVQNYKIKNLILSASNKLIDEFGIGVCLSYLVILIIHFLGINESIEEIIIDGKIKLLKELDLSLLNTILKENEAILKLNFALKLSNILAKNSKEDTLFESNRIQILPQEIYLKINRENKADFKYLSVALASNLAKVYRDDLMQDYSQLYPAYNWHQNKGYGSKYHREQILKHPDNKFLRQTFLSKILNLS